MVVRAINFDGDVFDCLNKNFTIDEKHSLSGVVNILLRKQLGLSEKK